MLGLDGQLDVAVEHARLVALDLRQDDAALLGHDRRRHHVDVGDLRPDQPGQRGADQRARVHRRGRAVEQDLDLLDRILGDLADEGAEHFGELDEGLQPRRFLGGDRRHVDGVGDRALDQIVGHLLGDLQRDVLLRLAWSRRRDAACTTTFSMPNSALSVAGSTSNTSMPAPATLPLFSAAIRSASTTSPPRAQLMMRTPSFILAIAAGVDDVAGLVGQRRVQRDEIGAREQLVEFDLLDAEFGRALLRQERIDRR